jgi:hypothetical protein
MATTDDEHNAYLTAHEAGWTHANYVASYGDGGKTLTTAAVEWAAGRYEKNSRVYLRAVEGFREGAEQFANEDHDDV